MTLSQKQRRFIGFILAAWIMVPALSAFAGTIQYAYDDLDRLIRAEYENGTVIKYGYDHVGNRLQGAVTTSSGSCEDRTVCNGDFEQEFSYWESTDNAAIVPGRSGEGADVAYDGANNDLVQLLPGVFETDTTYRITAWCLAEVGEQCGLFFGDSNDAYGPPYEHAVWQWADGTGDWQAITAELTLSHEERLNVYLYSNVSGSAVIYDDVQVEEVVSCEDRSVCNGDFEQAFDFWESTDNATLVSGRSGQGAQVTYDGANNDLVQLLPGVFETETTYRVTAWCLADVGEQCGLFFGDSNDAYGPPYEHTVWQWADGTGDWQAITADLTLSHEERLNVYLYSNVSGSAVIYDDVQVEEVSVSCEDRTVCNGDFEQAFDFWESTDNATLVSGRSGQGADVAYDGANNDILQLLPGVFETDKTYRITAWCLAEVGEQCGLFFGDSNDAYGPPYEHAVWQWADGTGDWQAITAELTLSHEERLNVYLYSNVSGSAVIYDDVQVEEVASSLLTVTKAGTGTGTLLVGGQECGPACEELQIPYADYALLTVIPAVDSHFVRLEREDGTPVNIDSFEVSPGETIFVIFEQNE